MKQNTGSYDQQDDANLNSNLNMEQKRINLKKGDPRIVSSNYNNGGMLYNNGGVKNDN